MKFNRLQKILSCLLMSVLALQASFFFLADPAKATNTQVWSEITPRKNGDPALTGWFGSLPPISESDMRYAGHPSYYVKKWTSVADLVETKPNGSKVFHFFVGIPCSNQYPWNGLQSGRVYHYSSADPTKTWNLVSPSDWGSYGGAIHITLKAIKQTWVDGNGSIWNKKLFMFCNSTSLINNWDQYYYYNFYKASFYRYDGNGSASGWINMADTGSSAWNYSLGSYYPGSMVQGHYASKAFFEYIDTTNDGLDNGTVYLICPYAFSPQYYGNWQWRLRILRYTGTRNATTDDLITTPVPPKTWDYTEIPTIYAAYYYQGYPLIFDVEKVNNYLFISTSTTFWAGNEPYNSNGLLYRFDAATNTVMTPTSSAAPEGVVVSGLMTDSSRPGYYYFNVRIGTPSSPLVFNWCSRSVTGGVIYRAYIRRMGYFSNYTNFYMNFGSDYDYTSNLTYYWSYYVYPGNYAQPQRSMIKWKVTAGTKNDSTLVMDLDALVAMPYYGYYMLYQRCYGWGNYESYNSKVLDGSAAPISLKYFKGHLYGGSKAGMLRRTDDFTSASVLEYSNWTAVSPITATNGAGQVRNMNYPVTALGKNTKVNTLGQEEDVTMFIGGFQQTSPYSTGEGILYATNGGTTTPISYFIIEDEWRYTKDETTASRMYKGTIWHIYDIYSSSLGLVASFMSSRRRYSVSDGGGFGDRYFHMYNALPTCEILVTPDPVINERGSDTDVCFTFSPIGGFGSGNVQIFLQGFPINVYLPTKDANNTPINLQVSDSPFVIKAVNMNGGVLTVCAVIRSTRSAQVGTYSLTVTIRDLVLEIDVPRTFTFLVVYPRPGFSERLSPSMIELYQGDCDTGVTNQNVILQQYCNASETISCQEINVDLESRNEFEENVVMGMYWLTEPPSQDITAEWKQSPFVYDYIDTHTVEVITRKNISTRYSFVVKVTPNTTVGVWKLKLFFLSGTIKHFKTLTITVLRAKPCIEITSIPKIIRVVPGANAQYRIQVKSIDYNGKVSLSLANVPPDVEVVDFYAENPPPGYADNFVELVSGGIVYAVLELRTYAITIDPYPPANVIVTNLTDTKNVISWDGSKQGTNPVAGYEIWRGLSQYTDKALKLGTVPATKTQFDDDNFDRTKTYYYFVRAFDDQTPPNYSEWAQSDPFSMTADQEDKAQIMASSIPHDGSAPGRFEIYVIGQGAGFNDITHQQTEVCGVGIASLQIFEQVKDMATPFFSNWGWFLILVAMVAVFFVLSKRIELRKDSK